MVEAVKYRQENIATEHLFSAPTEAFKPWFSTLALYLEDDINTRARNITEDGSVKLRMGTELEFLMFSPQFDPLRHSQSEKNGNPNYDKSHIQLVQQVIDDMFTPRDQGGLRELLYNSGEKININNGSRHYYISSQNIFMEIRTKPGTVQDYKENLEELQVWMKKEAEKKDIRPVVHSQHIHFSLFGEQANAFQINAQATNFVRKSTVDMYHRALPVLRLPEEIEDGSEKHKNYSATDNFPHRTVITFNGFGADRFEGRINNSEYAFDPYLNLVVHLLGIHRGLVYSKKPLGYTTLDRDYPLDSTTMQQDSTPWFSREKRDFNTALSHLTEDKVLNEYFPSEVIHAIRDVVASYRDVSEGRLSVGDLKRIANAKAYELDPDMYVLEKGK